MSTRDLSYTTAKTFAQSIRMMSFSKQLVETDDSATKREAYYVSKNWGDAKFKDQPESDSGRQLPGSSGLRDKEDLRAEPTQSRVFKPHRARVVLEHGRAKGGQLGVAQLGRRMGSRCDEKGEHESRVDDEPTPRHRIFLVGALCARAAPHATISHPGAVVFGQGSTRGARNAGAWTDEMAGPHTFSESTRAQDFRD